MTLGGTVPEALMTVVAAATVFSVMFVIGLGIVPREFRWVWQHSGLVAKGLFSVLIAVPALALVVARAFDLARPVEIGILLMAISPGAPVALRRSIGAGGHHSFAPALQILVAVLAVVSMPVWIALLNEVYAGHATIDPTQLARQVFTAQLLPLGLGILIRYRRPTAAAWLESKLARIATGLLLLLAVLAIIDIGQVVVNAGPRIVLAIATVTALALAVGHLLGGPDPATRTAVAISSAIRNPGLALLVATLNAAPPEITATVLAYLIVSAVAVIPYVAWRRRRPDPVERE
jgi:BASS family bile acid:Na+ symporter